MATKRRSGELVEPASAGTWAVRAEVIISEERIVPTLKSTEQSPSGNRGGVIDLVAFVAVLVVGWILIAVSHVGAATLAAYSTTVAGLYVSWHRR